MSTDLSGYGGNAQIPEVQKLFRGGKAEEAPDPSVLRFLIDMLRHAKDPFDRRSVSSEGVRPEAFDRFNPPAPEIERIKEEWGR